MFVTKLNDITACTTTRMQYFMSLSHIQDETSHFINELKYVVRARTSAMSDTQIGYHNEKKAKMKVITLGTKEFNSGTAFIAHPVHTLLHYSFHRHSPPFFSPSRG
jgi:hypothetical protein